MSPEPPPPPKAQDVAAAITIRRLTPADSMEELTGLLHRAYRSQVEMGLQPLAGRQDVETTRKRSTNGECYVAVMREAIHRVKQESAPEGRGTQERGTHAGRERLVGTILFHEVEDAKGPPWFQNKHVDSFSQFAVDPGVQGRGIGQMLLDTVERRAVECGATEMGLSMAEPDTKLMEFYLRRGYRFVEHWQWPYTNYRSAILSKALKK